MNRDIQTSFYVFVLNSTPRTRKGKRKRKRIRKRKKNFSPTKLKLKRNNQNSSILNIITSEDKNEEKHGPCAYFIYFFFVCLTEFEETTWDHIHSSSLCHRYILGLNTNQLYAKVFSFFLVIRKGINFSVLLVRSKFGQTFWRCGIVNCYLFNCLSLCDNNRFQKYNKHWADKRS